MTAARGDRAAASRSSNSPAGAAPPPISDGEFSLLRDLLYERAGIDLKPAKKILVQNRLRRRLAALGLESYVAYHRRLLTVPDEMRLFLDALTTNETFFFREEKHWAFLRETVVPEAIRRAREGAPRRFSVWSTAASSGEELYTAGIVLLESLPDPDAWQIRLVGTDLNTDVVARAREGRYGAYAVRQVPPNLLKRHFEPMEGDFRRVGERLRRLATFRNHNLLDPFPQKGFDLVLCRNVFIYFDRASKETVVRHLADSTARGGYVFFSHTEALVPRLPDLEALRPSIFRRT